MCLHSGWSWWPGVLGVLKDALRNLAMAPAADVQEEQLSMMLLAVSHSLHWLVRTLGCVGDSEVVVAWAWTFGNLSRKVAALTSSLGTSWVMVKEVGHRLVSLARKAGPRAQVECLSMSIKVAPPLVPGSAGLSLPGM